MSFVKTLATLAIGFAAARGYTKYRDAGGMPAVKDAVKKAGEPGGLVDQWGQQAEKLGVPGGSKTVREIYDRFGGAAEATEAGLGGLIASMTSAATAGGKMMGDMMEAVSGATPASALHEANAKLMIRAMIMAAKADGEIDAAERQKIMDHLTDASEEEIAFVEAALDAPVDVPALAQETGEAMREQIYATSLMAITVDTPAEQAYLAQLGSALGLSAEARAKVHASMGKPAPAASAGT
jgi:uncharacterized membrane protein YebE (DUF533 family)